jgi:hypothetical protein
MEEIITNALFTHSKAHSRGTYPNRAHAWLYLMRALLPVTPTTLGLARR